MNKAQLFSNHVYFRETAWACLRLTFEYTLFQRSSNSLKWLATYLCVCQGGYTLLLKNLITSLFFYTCRGSVVAKNGRLISARSRYNLKQSWWSHPFYIKACLFNVVTSFFQNGLCQKVRCCRRNEETRSLWFPDLRMNDKVQTLWQSSSEMASSLERPCSNQSIWRYCDITDI